MQKLNGRFQYLGWFNLPWKLVMDSGEIDFWPIVEKFFLSLNGKSANDKRDRNGYMLFADKNSEFNFEYVPGEYVLLKKSEGIGMSNIHAFFDDVLVWLSGRLVNIEVGDAELKFAVDESEKVFGIYFTGEGNYCEVPEGAENTVCKAGQNGDCCAFLILGSDGFECAKFSGSTARMLLDKVAKGTIRATRIGNCALLGRK